MLRTRAGLSVRALAEAVGTDSGNLSRLENGKSGYSEETLKRIADVLNVSLSMLFSEYETLEAAVRKHREIPVLEAEQLAVWGDPETFEPAEKQAYLQTDRRVSSFGFGLIVADEANAPKFTKGYALIFDVRRQPSMGSMIVAIDRDKRIYIGHCRLAAPGEDGFSVVPQNRVYPVISSATTQGLTIRGTLVESREYYSD
jgi:transcriptional regulator with XRE-family HTH domain